MTTAATQSGPDIEQWARMFFLQHGTTDPHLPEVRRILVNLRDLAMARVEDDAPDRRAMVATAYLRRYAEGRAKSLPVGSWQADLNLWVSQQPDFADEMFPRVAPRPRPPLGLPMLVVTPNNLSTAPFADRERAADCVGCFARTKASEHAPSEVVQLHDWAATRYWGERVFEVRDGSGVRYDRLESELTPVEATHPDVLAFAARLQGALLHDALHILADAASI